MKVGRLIELEVTAIEFRPDACLFQQSENRLTDRRYCVIRRQLGSPLDSTGLPSVDGGVEVHDCTGARKSQRKNARRPPA